MLQAAFAPVRRALLPVSVFLLLVFMSMSIVLAQSGQNDGRINQAAHFGGDTLYCVDANYRPTVQYPRTEGGFRLLNIQGQELWFVPAADVAAAVDEAEVNGEPVLVAEGTGSHGPTAIYASKVSEAQTGIYFTFTGYDEHGKTNSLTFQLCFPVYGASPIVNVLPATNTSVAPTSVVPTATASATLAPSATATMQPTATTTLVPVLLCVDDIGFDEDENIIYYTSPCECPEPFPFGESGYYTCSLPA